MIVPCHIIARIFQKWKQTRNFIFAVAEKTTTAVKNVALTNNAHLQHLFFTSYVSGPRNDNFLKGSEINMCIFHITEFF